MTAPPATDIERLAIDTVRTLSMDAVQKANSGHPGMPMAMAPLAYLLFREVMNHDPKDPAWPDRDRFVLSAGHGSMWLYSALHLSGYDICARRPQAVPPVGIDHARAPGARPCAVRRPASRSRPVRWARASPNGVGLAMAERFLRERYGAEVQDHRTYVICSDGDLMEGIASEAALARRQARARPHGLHVRRQRDLARRADHAELRQRGRHRSLRGLPLARAVRRGRQRPRCAAGRDQGRPGGGGSALPHPGQDRHRLARPEQDGHEQGPRLAARRGRGPRRQGGAGLGSGRALPRARRRLRGIQRGRQGRCRARRVDRALPRVARRRTRTARPSGTPPGAARRCPASPTRCPRRGRRTRSRRARRASRSWRRSRRACRPWSAAQRT